MRRRDTPCIELVSYGLHSLLWMGWLQVVQMKNPIKVVTITRGNHNSVRWILKRTVVPVYGVGISFPATFFALRLTPFIGHLLFFPYYPSLKQKNTMPIDINLLRDYKGGNSELVRESQRKRNANVQLVDDVIALDNVLLALWSRYCPRS